MDTAAHDREDDRLLAAGAHAELIARHYPAMVERLRMRLPEGEALEVVHEAVCRLMDELRRGRRYAVPFRVVAHQVVTWKLRERGYGRESPLAQGAPAEPSAPDELEQLTDRLDLLRRLAGLPEGQRRVLELRYLEGLSIPEIATRLGMSRNAVDQALHRGHRSLRRTWGGG